MTINIADDKDCMNLNDFGKHKKCGSHLNLHWLPIGQCPVYKWQSLIEAKAINCLASKAHMRHRTLSQQRLCCRASAAERGESPLRTLRLCDPTAAVRTCARHIVVPQLPHSG